MGIDEVAVEGFDSRQLGRRESRDEPRAETILRHPRDHPSVPIRQGDRRNSRRAAAGDEVTWQLGCSERDDLPGSVHREVKPTEFRKLAQEADVTITHAGVGSILELLDMGITPAIVVRSQDNAEHVDNHQRQIAAAMTSRGLAFGWIWSSRHVEPWCVLRSSAP